MEKKSFINVILQNTRKPEGFFGRLILRGMNTGHAPLARWGMSHLDWQPDWNVLDIGCGGGANLAQILKRCPSGKAYGVDLSPESVKFARKKNKKHLNTRCFVEQGNASQLPYPDKMFHAVSAFETVYFWEDLHSSFTEISRVLKEGGFFLICCEISDPSNDMWSSRIQGMVIHPAGELKETLARCGFSGITIYKGKKEELCIVAQKQTDKKQKEE